MAEVKPEQAEVHDISFEENTGRAIFAETKVAPRRAMSFRPQNKRDALLQRFSLRYSPILSGTYATLITESGNEAKRSR